MAHTRARLPSGLQATTPVLSSRLCARLWAPGAEKEESANFGSSWSVVERCTGGGQKVRGADYDHRS